MRKMTDRDIDALIAEEVMEWQEGPIKGHWYEITPNGELSVASTKQEWRPSTLIGRAWQVAEKLNEVYDCQVSVRIVQKLFALDGCRYACQISGGKLAYDSPDLYLTVLSDSPCKAICLATLKGIGVEIAGVDEK